MHALAFCGLNFPKIAYFIHKRVIFFLKDFFQESFNLALNPRTNACLCECMPYLTTSQHLCVNAWTHRMHVLGKTKG